MSLDREEIIEDPEADLNFEILYKISNLLNTGLDPDALAICVQIIENGTNPESLASAMPLLFATPKGKSLRDGTATVKPLKVKNSKVESLKARKPKVEFLKDRKPKVESLKERKPKEEPLRNCHIMKCGIPNNDVLKDFHKLKQKLPNVESLENFQRLKERIPKVDYPKGFFKPKVEPRKNKRMKLKFIKHTKSNLGTVYESDETDVEEDTEMDVKSY